MRPAAPSFHGHYFDGEFLWSVLMTRLQAVVSKAGIPTYQELRRGWVNTAALLGSGSLIRYESVLGCRRGRVASGRALRAASVSGGQPHDDKNCVVLLVAAVHDRHGRPPIHRKNLRGGVRRPGPVGRPPRRVAGGAAP